MPSLGQSAFVRLRDSHIRFHRVAKNRAPRRLRMVCILICLYAAAAITSSAQSFSVFVTFDGPHGATPESAPIQGSDGNFYGTTFNGGAHGFGAVYRVDTQGIVTVLHSFCSQSGCADGSFPVGGLVEGNDGNFYGTTTQGGAHNVGTVFVISAGGSFNVLHSFQGPDGINPYAGLVLANDGNFYGTTESGGNGGGESRGTVFKITPAGVLTTIYKFCSVGACSDGAFPFSPLVQASDGNFYGTTSSGGHDTCVLSCGTVFKITPDGTLTTLHSFSQSDGAEPFAGLVQASDGNLYGTTWMGGSSSGCGRDGCGIIFKITMDGAFTNLYNFCTQSNCADGQNPYYGRLVQASDGLLYGATWQGGSDNTCSNGCGVIFRIELGGRFTTVHSFTRTTDGASPLAGLIQASDGKLYGTTTTGGDSGIGKGTLYRLTPAVVPQPVQFVSATPCRVVDTRDPDGPFGGPILQGNSTRSFTLPQTPHCNIPAGAAYSLNVTVVPDGPLGYLTIWPTGQDQPVVSTLNSLDGRIKANAAIVPAGTNGAVSVYVTNTTHVVIDIDGYFATPGQNTYAFYPMRPCRVIDTRNPNGHLGGPYLHGMAERDFPVLESPCLIGLDPPQAYSFNVTVVPHPDRQALGYLTVWPQGQEQPVVSTLNNLTATVVANAALVPAGSGGGIAVFPSNDTDLVVDINGYFAAPSLTGTSLYPVTPCRAYDSRDNGGQPFQGERTVDIVDSPCAPSVNAQAYVLNATVVPQHQLGYLTLWPDGEDQPVVSTLNALDGWITSNMAVVPTTNGSIDAYAAGLTQLVLDISGYFAP